MGATSQTFIVDDVELKLREQAIEKARERDLNYVLLDIQGKDQLIALDDIERKEQ